MAISDDEFDQIMARAATPASQKKPLVNETVQSPTEWMRRTASDEGGGDDEVYATAEMGMQPKKPSAMGDVLRGIDQLQSTGGGLAMLIGNAMELKSVEDWGKEVYNSNNMEARHNPAAVGSVENIHGVKDALAYAREAVLENLPMFLPSMATGGAGGILARRSAEGYVKNLVTKLGEEEAAKLIAKRVFIGSTLGAYGSSAAQEMGDIYGGTVEDTGVENPGYAFGAGAVAGLLDAIPEGSLLKNVLGPKVAAQVAKPFIKQLGEEGFKQFLKEAPTEAIQTIIEESARTNADPSQDLFSPERVMSYVDAAAKGGIAGGIHGAIGEGLGHFLRPHPDSVVRDRIQEVMDGAAEMVSPDVAEEEDAKVTEQDKQYAELNKQIEQLAATPSPENDQKRADLLDELVKLESQMQGGEEVKLADASEEAAPAAQQAAAPEAKALVNESEDPVVGFTTAKGSTYQVHEDGTTTRDKSVHPEHPGDTGIKPRSQATFYVDDEGADKLGEVQTENVGKKTLRKMPDGKWGVFYLDGKDAGKIEGRTVTEVQTKPAVGLTPVEMWTDSEQPHFGNKITEIQTAKPADDSVVPKSGSFKDLSDATLETKRLALVDERAFLSGLGKETGMDTNERNSRIKEIDAMLADDSRLNTLQNQPVHSFPGKPLPDGLEKEHVDAKREEVHAAVDALVNENDGEAGATYKGQIKAALEPYMNFLAGEGITVSKTPEAEFFRAVPRANGKIELQVPSLKNWDKRNDGAARRGMFRNRPEVIPKLTEHEIVHTAMYAQLRSDWEAKQKRGGFDQYARGRIAQIGGWLRMSYRGMAKDLLAVYDPSGKIPEKEHDFTTGTEFLRMMVERARTGMLTEDVQAQAQLAANGGVFTQALQSMVKAAQRIREVIARYLNPETSTPAIQKVYQQINDVLDKYSIVQPNPVAPISEVKPHIDETPEHVPPKRLTPITNPEASSLPQPDAAELAARRRMSDQKREEKQQAPSRRAMLSKIEEAREAVDQRSPEAGDKIKEAAAAHAGIRLKWNNQLRTATAKAQAKGEFETALQRKVTQKQYNEAIEMARETGASNAEPTQENDAEDNRAASIAEELGIAYDGKDRRGLLFTDTDGTSAAFGSTITAPEGASVDEVRERLAASRGEDAGIGASNAQPSNQVLDADYRTGKKLDSMMPPTALVNEKPRNRLSSDKFQQLDLTPEEREYRQQNLATAAFEARDFINKIGGTMAAADFMIANPLGGGRLEDAEIRIVQRQVIQGLRMILDDIEDNDADYDAEDFNLVYGMKEKMDRIFADTGITVGRIMRADRVDELFMDGDRAKRDYVDVITAKFKKIFGKQGQAWLERLTFQLNEMRSKAMNKIITRPELVAYLRKIQSDMNDPKWRKAARESMSKERGDNYSGKAASRAAEMAFGDLNNEPALKEAINRILGQMTFGIPRVDNGVSPSTILSQALSEVTRDVAREAGAIPEGTPRQPITDTQKLAELLRNPEHYSAFVANLEERMVDKFGDKSTSPNFRSAMNDFVRGMTDRSWQDGLIDKVVAEKARELKTTMTQIVRDHYENGGTQKLENLRAAVIKGLKDHGVSDETIGTEVANDIDARIERSIDKARERWAGSAGGIRRGLREMGLTLAQVAGQGMDVREKTAEDLSKVLIRRLGLPDTRAFPHASRLRDIIHNALSDLTQKETASTIERLSKAAPPEIRTVLRGSKGERAMERIVGYANMGALTNEAAYGAIARRLKLPAYNEVTARRLEQWGKLVANMNPGRERTEEIMKINNFIASQKGVTWKDMAVSTMYAFMLSGPATHLVNAVSNGFNLMAEIYVRSVQNPQQLPILINAAIAGLSMPGAIELGETFRSGLASGKFSAKIEGGGNPFEFEEPVFQDAGAEAYDKFISLTRIKPLLRGVTRTLQAVDMMFYKAAQEVSFAARTGYTGYGEAFRGFKDQARQELISEGINPDDKAGRRRVNLRAIGLLEAARQTDPNTAFAWREAHGEALNTTFNNEPRGLIGALATSIASWSTKYKLSKLIIPFTKVVANVLNTQLDWSPVGIGRFYLSDDFKMDGPEGEKLRDPKILIRGITGTLVLGGLLAALAKHDDDDDPWFTIYGSGPRDTDKKRQLYERGWKPNTIKVGGVYYSYMQTPIALALASVGTVMDRHRENPDMNVLDYIPQAGLAFVQGTFSQSFLSSAGDLMSSLDSPDPEKAMSRFIARTATLPVPNFFKQIDAWIDPSVQQSNTFMEAVLKQIPVVREMSGLKPMLNVFGQPVSRTPGPLNLPFSSRFVTLQKDSDPVFAYLGEKQMTVPSFAKQTHLGDKPMTDEEFYSYVKIAGPQIHEALRQEIPSLRQLTKEQAQDRINTITQGIKRQARSGMLSR